LASISAWVKALAAVVAPVKLDERTVRVIFLMSSRTDKEWEVWGQTNPYFAVLSNNDYRGTLNEETKRAFFISGEQHVSRVLRNISAHLVQNFHPRTALDFGCGVGRTTIPLARICDTTGVDVSTSMRSEAYKNARLSGVEISLEAEASGTYDLIHSYIVFQHIPIRTGIGITKQLLSRVNPGGVAVLHFTYRSTKSPLVKAINWLRYRIPLIQYATNFVRGRPLFEPPTQMNSYPLGDLLSLVEGRRMFVEHTNHGGYLGVVIYVLMM
jgi:SAM-dependent methyltransferase